jgi:hypothetical protein
VGDREHSTQDPSCLYYPQHIAIAKTQALVTGCLYSIPALPLTGSVSLNNLLSLSVLNFLTCKMDMTVYFINSKVRSWTSLKIQVMMKPWPSFLSLRF